MQYKKTGVEHVSSSSTLRTQRFHCVTWYFLGWLLSCLLLILGQKISKTWRPGGVEFPYLHTIWRLIHVLRSLRAKFELAQVEKVELRKKSKSKGARAAQLLQTKVPEWIVSSSLVVGLSRLREHQSDAPRFFPQLWHTKLRYPNFHRFETIQAAYNTDRVKRNL